MGNCCGCDHRDDCGDAEPEVKKTTGCKCPKCDCDPCKCGEESDGAEVAEKSEDEEVDKAA